MRTKMAAPSATNMCVRSPAAFCRLATIILLRFDADKILSAGLSPPTGTFSLPAEILDSPLPCAGIKSKVTWSNICGRFQSASVSLGRLCDEPLRRAFESVRRLESGSATNEAARHRQDDLSDTAGGCHSTHSKCQTVPGRRNRKIIDEQQSAGVADNCD